ncbi:fimbrial protein [Collimonas sp.]|jgi:major type 1 subunit fimbrin (pilin)|uniref:fimbrial protein n=1 Tax=Collimonas sp. TaxID=1963772 RepID=UPI002BA36E79|nr:fimbrial protein [Collimonas sp.]HWW07796.1 fimbrial protein [Collimonas sp.]
MSGFSTIAGRTAILLSCLCTGAASAATGDTSGTITFTGSITGVPCEIDSTTSKDVTMPKVFANDFTGSGSTVPPVAFKIVLSGCNASSTGATLKFTGTTDSTNTAVLKVTGTSPATGVGVQLLDSTGTAIDMAGGTKNSDITIAEGTNTYDFKARYIATADKVVAGAANATLMFSLTYK